MFNSFQYNQSYYNSLSNIVILHDYIEDLDFIINCLIEDEDLQNYLEDVDINIVSISTIATDFINRFLRVHLKRNNRIDVLLERRILDLILLERPQFSVGLVRKSPIKINLKRPRFEIHLERVGDK